MPEYNSGDLQRATRLQFGPLRLPAEITRSTRTIRLFMTYLDQPPTQAAIMAIAFQKGRKAAVQAGRALESLLEVGVPGIHEELCYLVARAPFLQTVNYYAWQIDDENIIPEEALLGDDVIKASIRAYHAWVRSLGR